MPTYRVITTFEEGTDQAKGPGEIIELTEEQAGPFVKSKRLAPYTEPKTFVQDDLLSKSEKHKLPPPDEPEEQPTPESSAFARELEKHTLLPDELPGLTVKQLVALPEWEQVLDPKPTRKDKIIAAIRAVRGT